MSVISSQFASSVTLLRDRVEHRFDPEGLYILDEPESALSPQRQLAVLYRLHGLVLQGSQFVIATHSHNSWRTRTRASTSVTLRASAP